MNVTIHKLEQRGENSPSFLSLVPGVLLLFVVVRPVSVWLGLIGAPVSRDQGAMIGWFGIRGIGSIYYLMYTIHQGLPLRINVDAELWHDRLFDSEDSRAQWKASVVYDPVTLLYDVEVFEQEVRDTLPGELSIIVN